jgi:hypothetical protein
MVDGAGSPVASSAILALLTHLAHSVSVFFFVILTSSLTAGHSLTSFRVPSGFRSEAAKFGGHQPLKVVFFFTEHAGRSRARMAIDSKRGRTFCKVNSNSSFSAICPRLHDCKKQHWASRSSACLTPLLSAPAA